MIKDNLKLINKIQTQAISAINIFKKVFTELEKANEKLSNIIREKNNKIQRLGNNVYIAECSINNNDTIINNIKRFLNES